MTYKQGDILRVPFPYTDRDTHQNRPVLVVSNGGIGEDSGLLWVMMITSRGNRSWPGDFPLEDGEANLPAPSVVRTCKLATVEARHTEPLGQITDVSWSAVAELLAHHHGWRPVE